ncbi:MAG: hydrogenase iron-sulfur subunit [Bacteroidales bacterium]|nr:hydrogenase iron-sulfur subunit [Bacteroidales bacterium]
MAGEKHIGVYICSGCEIGNCIDVAKSCLVAKEEFKVTDASVHPALCSVEGYDLILRNIEKHSLDAVLIAACSPRVKTEVFDFTENILIERVNLREQVAWCFEPNEEDTRMAADDTLRIGIEKVRNTSNPKPFISGTISDEILIVGGGIAGMTAAIEGAKAGYKVHLVEKEESLGGKQHELYKQYPTQAPFGKLTDPLLASGLAEIDSLENIMVYTSTGIEEIKGQPGAFEVTLLNSGLKQLRVGAVVAAMGWKPYDPNNLSHLGYGKSKQVITIGEFEKMVKENPSLQLPKNILFIQCAGSRDANHLPYCSSYCCSTSLKQAKYIRELSPESSVYIVYKDIRTPGLGEAFYNEVQNDDQIFFTKGEIGEVVPEKENLRVTVTHTLLGEEISLQVDLIILATGMVPAGTDDLNLNYRLGKGLPELKYNFSDSHFICFPYETRRTGIYAAGCVRAPMDIAASMEDAAGAMFKAIQCIEATKRGEAVHPRSGDKSFPDLYMDRCTDCKRCTEECPFGAYDETAKGTPLPNPNRCRRCGICLGSCPERVISFSNFSVNSISAMIKAVEIPDEFEEKPRILVFVCENDAYPAIDMAGTKRLKYSPFVRIIPVRCLGSINKVWISDALSCGYDGILQIGCKPGDDYQCHFIHGSELTEKRGENIQEALQTMMLEPERIRTEFVEITDYHKIPEIINSYVKEIEEIGPNPFKGM